MKKAKRKKLERQGWKVGSAAEFLNLSTKQARLVESKLGRRRAYMGAPI